MKLEKTTTAGQTSKEVDRRRHCRKRGRTENIAIESLENEALGLFVEIF